MQPKSPIAASARARSTLLVACTLAVTACIVGSRAEAQQIVKWTDESGHVHYSDHAPAGHTSVNAVTLSKSAAGSNTAPDPQYTEPQASDTGLAADYDVDQAAASARRTENQRREEQQQAQLAARKKADQAVIDRCKADHMINCKDGADAIRQREHMAALMQCTNPAGCQAVQKAWQDQQNSLNPGN